MKKILVYYGYSQKNAGDMAICLGLLDMLEEIKDCQITLVSRYSKEDSYYIESKAFFEKYHPNIVLKPGYISFNRASGVLSKVKSYLSGFFVSTFKCFNKRMRHDVDDADLVLFNGGNYLRCNSLTDKLRLRALFFPIKYAKKAGKPIICMPQSSTTAKNKRSLKALQKVCGYFDKIFVREPISYKYLLDNNVCDEKRIVQSCDLAFFSIDRFKGSDNKSIDKNNNVAINARITGIGDIGKISDEKINMIKECYESLIQKHQNKHFSFVCQTDKDDAFMKELYECFINKGYKNISYKKSNDAYELKRIYKDHGLLISMRLHASILALSVNTPVIGFTFDEWGFKNKGILNQFSSETFDSSEGVLNKVESFYNEKQNQSNEKTINNFKNEIINEIERVLF